MDSRTYEDFVQEASQYKNILLNYKRTGAVFEDPNFHPKAKIQELSIQFNEKQFAWMRIDKFFKSPLFKPDLIDPNFIQQGELGDCYFLSALSRIANQPDLVKSLFDTDQPAFILGEEEDSINIKCGAVVVYFHAFGRETPVLIDTLIPFKRGTRTPRFSHPTDLKVSPWFCLVEKAYAKLNGSYAGITSGQFPTAIYSLFGYFPDSKMVKDLKNPAKMVKMSPFDRLMKYQREGSVMDASIHTQYYTNGVTNDNLIDLGLMQGHSYLIMKARIEDHKNFLCLRNPWGDHEWLGDWSDTSELWTEELKEALGMEEAEDGIFWMIDNDFFYYFTSIDIARPIPDDLHSRRFDLMLEPGPHDGFDIKYEKADAGNRPNFAIEITEPIRPGEKCKVYFIIERRHPVVDPKTNRRIMTTPLQISFLKTGGKKLTTDVFSRSGGKILTSSNDLIGLKREIQSNQDIYTIYMNRLKKETYTEYCYVQVICKYDFKLYDIDNPEDIMPEAVSGGIFLDNYSLRHPDVALPIVKKQVKGRTVSRFDTEKKAEPAKPKKEKVVQISQEDLNKAQEKLQEEAKAKEKAEEEAKEAMEEINRLKQMMKEMEEKIAQQEKALQEEKEKAKDEEARAKQEELEKELELEKTLLETNRVTLRNKKRDAKKLRQKAKKKQDEVDEVNNYNNFLLESFRPDKKPIKKKPKKDDEKDISVSLELTNPPELFDIITDDDEDPSKKEEAPAKEEAPTKDKSEAGEKEKKESPAAKRPLPSVFPKPKDIDEKLGVTKTRRKNRRKYIPKIVPA